MATETDDIILNSVHIEDAGVSLKRVTVEISADEIANRLDTSLSLLRSRAALPGFRPGKAPTRLLERKFGQGMREETRNELVQKSFRKVVDEHKFRVVGEPIIKDAEKIEIQPGAPLKITFEIEVMPDFEMPNLEGVALRKPTLEVSETLVDTELKNQQTRFGRMEDVGDEPGPGHYFFGSVVLLDEHGAKIAELPKHVTRWPEPKKDAAPASIASGDETAAAATEEEVGPEGVEAVAGAIGGIRIENLGEHLRGRKVGDVVNIETVGPANHEVIPVRGRNVRLEFTIGRITRLIPATTEHLVELFGFEDEAELREQIGLVLNMRIEGEQREVMRAQVIRYLLDNIQMELPERISEAQTRRVMGSARLRLQQRGMPDVQIEEKIADLRTASLQRAQHDLKAQFILDRLVMDSEIQVTERELNGRIMGMAQQRGVRPDKFREDLIKNNQVYLLANQIAHEKAVDLIIEKGNVTTLTAEEWNKEMQGTQNAAGSGAAPAGSAEGEPQPAPAAGSGESTGG